MKKYILLIILSVILGALPLFIQYGDYLMCTDFARQEIPFIMETKRMLLSGTPWWSWNTYYGDNFLGSYGFYTLTSPFVWLLCLLPYEWIVKSIFIVLVLKYICAFLTSRLFLRKMDVSNESACVGGLLYAFSSYVISNSFYYHFFEPLIVFPLLLVAAERYLRRERYGCTALLAASFLTAFINYYFAVGSFVAAAMYVFCRMLFTEMRREWRRVPLALLLVGMGIAMDAFVLLPTAMQLSGGPRSSGHLMSGLDYTWWPFFVERLRVLFMPQVLEQPTSLFRMTGFHSTSVCLPLLGMFAVALYCWKHKRNWLTALTVLSLLAFLTPGNTVLSGFTNPDYTRWAYALCLFLALVSCKWLDEQSKSFGYRHVVGYALAILFVFCFALYIGRKDVSGEPATELEGESRALLLLAYSVLAVVNVIALCVYCKWRKGKVLAACVVVCAISQMCLFHLIRSDVYFAETNDIQKQGILKVYVKNNCVPRSVEAMHYRTVFSNRFPNACMMTNRPDVQTFHSVQNNEVRRLMIVADTLTCIFNQASPTINRRSFYALMSVKDVIAYDDPQAPFKKDDLNLTQKERGDGYTIYNNEDYLPMGFTYDSYIEEAIIDTLNARKPKPDVPLQMLANLAVPKEEEAFFAKHLRHGTLVAMDTLVSKSHEGVLDSLVRERRKCVASSFDGTTTGFTSTITLPKEDVVFYSVPADKGFTAYVDGRETAIHPCNLGLCAVLVSKGTHTVEFRFLPRGLKAGASVSLAMLILALGLLLWEYKH